MKTRQKNLHLNALVEFLLDVWNNGDNQQKAIDIHTQPGPGPAHVGNCRTFWTIILLMPSDDHCCADEELTQLIFCLSTQSRLRDGWSTVEAGGRDVVKVEREPWEPTRNLRAQNEKKILDAEIFGCDRL